MKGLTSILIYFLVQASFAQRQSYYKQLKEETVTHVGSRIASGVELDIINFDEQDYAEILLDAFNQKRKLKRKPEFVQDVAFNKLCMTGIQHYPSSFFRKKKNGSRILKHVEFGLRYLKGGNRMYRIFTFNFNLTELKDFERFYYARGDETTALKLFHGKRPITMNPEHEKYEELVPVKPLTEQKFVETLIRKIQKKNGLREFYSHYYSHVGLAMRLDPFTVNRKKIPRAFVMVIIGGKQTQRVREQELPTMGNDDNSLYNLLK